MLDIMMSRVVALVVLWLGMAKIKITVGMMLVLVMRLVISFLEVINHFVLKHHELLEAHLLSVCNTSSDS